MASTVCLQPFAGCQTQAAFALRLRSKGPVLAILLLQLFFLLARSPGRRQAQLKDKRKDQTEFFRNSDTTSHWGGLRVLTVVMPSRHRPSSSPPAIICVER